MHADHVAGLPRHWCATSQRSARIARQNGATSGPAAMRGPCLQLRGGTHVAERSGSAPVADGLHERAGDLPNHPLGLRADELLHHVVRKRARARRVGHFDQIPMRVKVGEAECPGQDGQNRHRHPGERRRTVSLRARERVVVDAVLAHQKHRPPPPRPAWAIE
eukprot:scaffold21029_cov101-Isochrysis_galbana.AAC.1